MSIYTSSVDQIGTADLQELLTDSSVESVRLEFKLQDVSKDEALKKLTSLANTFGGYMIIGAKANADGRLVGLPGVEPISGLKQRMVAWGYEGAYPPLQLFVSGPIPAPQEAGKVCYVLYVPESEEAPHFITGRKGCYIRTDEFSSRFDAQLATYEEIQHLANRRALAVSRRDYIVGRALYRLATSLSSSGALPNPTILVLSICPQFPVRPLITHGKLIELLNSCRVSWRQGQFPNWSQPFSQHESVLVPEAYSGERSLFEVNLWGLLFYAYEAGEPERSTAPNASPSICIHLTGLIGHILVSLEHARTMYGRLGFDGSLLIRAKLDHLRGVELFLPDHRRRDGNELASPLNDSVDFDMVTDSAMLKGQRDLLAKNIIRNLLFALNQAGLASSDKAMEDLLAKGYAYCFWQNPESAPNTQ